MIGGVCVGELGVRGTKCAGKLLETAEGERELGVDVERGGIKAAIGEGELGAEGELEAELGLAGAALSDDFGEGIAGDAAAGAAVEDRTSESALLGGLKKMEEIFRCHLRREERQIFRFKF